MSCSDLIERIVLNVLANSNQTSQIDQGAASMLAEALQKSVDRLTHRARLIAEAQRCATVTLQHIHQAIDMEGWQDFLDDSESVITTNQLPQVKAVSVKPYAYPAEMPQKESLNSVNLKTSVTTHFPAFLVQQSAGSISNAPSQVSSAQPQSQPQQQAAASTTATGQQQPSNPLSSVLPLGLADEEAKSIIAKSAVKF
jgi:histone H3/H4